MLAPTFNFKCGGRGCYKVGSFEGTFKAAWQKALRAGWTAIKYGPGLSQKLCPTCSAKGKGDK